MRPHHAGRLAARLVAATSMLSALGCGGALERNSGEDAYRHKAAELKLGKPATSDVARMKGDRTDWKMVKVEKTGPYEVAVHVDREGAEMKVQVRDPYGRPLDEEQREAGGKPLKVRFDADEKGRYFIMIRQTGGAPTAYTAKVARAGGSMRPGF